MNVCLISIEWGLVTREESGFFFVLKTTFSRLKLMRQQLSLIRKTPTQNVTNIYINAKTEFNDCSMIYLKDVDIPEFQQFNSSPLQWQILLQFLKTTFFLFISPRNSNESSNRQKIVVHILEFGDNSTVFFFSFVYNIAVLIKLKKQYNTKICIQIYNNTPQQICSFAIFT